jgi:hypothetical protein
MGMSILSSILSSVVAPGLVAATVTVLLYANE